MIKNKKIIVQGTQIGLLLYEGENDFISLTDMAKRFGDDILIYQWMRNRNTVEFLGIWEQIHNSNFKGLEFDTFKFKIMKLFPNANKFHGISIPHPLINHCIIAKIFGHIG